MDKKEFRNLLQKATKKCKEFSLNYIKNSLDGKIKYYVYPNISFDKNPLIKDEEIFPEDDISSDKKYFEMTENEVIEFLWRNGKVPEWIDISSFEDENGYTIYRLLCCGRFTAKEELMYYSKQGNGPFGIKSPNIPSDWESIEESGKFWL